jgi:hypothetical protein
MSDSDEKKSDMRSSNDDMRASDGRNVTAEDRLPPERLDALVEGRLRGADRDAALSQLSRSVDDLELAADMLALADAELEDSASPVLPIAAARAKRFGVRRLWIAGAVAAMLTLIAVPIIRKTAAPEPVPSYAELVSKDVIGLPATWWDQGRPVVRGPATDGGGFATGVEIGTLIVDLRLLARTDTTAARPAAERIAALISKVGVATGVAAQYRAMADGKASLDAATLDAAERGVRSLAPFVEPDGVSAGAWLRAAWIAATTRDSAFFADPTSAREAESIDRRLGARALGLRAKTQSQRALAWDDLKSAIESSIEVSTSR